MWEKRLWAAFILVFVSGMAIIGCSSIKQEAFGSGWTDSSGTSTSIASGTSTVTGTSTATGATTSTMAVVAARPILKNGETTPVSVTLSNLASDSSPVKVAMSSSLGGTFDPAQGNTDNKTFMTTFTAPTFGSGPAQIVALAGSLVGSTSIQIIPSEPILYQLAVIPASPVVAQGKAVPISVKITDAFGKSVSDGEVSMFQTLDGTFEPAKGTLSQGFFSTTFTAGSQIGTCSISALYRGSIGTASVGVIAKTIDTLQATVIPALVALGQKQTTPITVKITNQRGETVDGIEVYLASSLEGTFDATKGTTSKGVFTTNFTSGTASGLNTITAMASGISGTANIQVTVNPILSFSAPNLTMARNTKQVLQIQATDDRGNPLTGAKLYISSTAGGTFDEASQETKAGLAYFTYTAPGLAGQETITIQGLGKTSSIVLTIQ